MAKKRSELDHYSLQAKKEGYPARSVYKLKELQERHQIIKRGDTLLDAGCSPGSWLLYASTLVKKEGRVIGVDQNAHHLNPLPSNATFLLSDLFSEDLESKLSDFLPLDVFLSDAAPKTTGNRTVDTARSEALVELLIACALKWLKPGGNFVSKIFQGGGEGAIKRSLQESFEEVKMVRPKSVRKESFEIYLVAKNYREDKKISDK